MAGLKEFSEIQHEIESQLRRKGGFTGDITFDQTSRILYSTDASIYHVEPLGVVFPRSPEDIIEVVQTASRTGVSIVPRGAGSGLAGQAIGPGVVVDCSRYMNRIVELDAQSRTAIVEPGIIMAALNRQAKKHGLQFGPDPASAERATVGGSIANNATGAHSIQYGMMVDHLSAVEMVLADGTTSHFSSIPTEHARQLASGDGLQAAFYRAALTIREKYAEEIVRVWPKTWRRVSGYNLNYLLPWSPSQPPLWEVRSGSWSSSQQDSLPYPPIAPGQINLASLVAGSEGTLGMISRASLRLVPLPAYTVLGVLSFPSVAEACDATPDLLMRFPAAVELIPYSLVHQARGVPAYAAQLSFLDPLLIHDHDHGALLVVEFEGDDKAELLRQASALGSGVWVAENPAAQKQVWNVRKVGLGILMSRLGGPKPAAFIEDIAVPVDRLGDFIRAVEQILAGYGVTSEVYAHASAGCLHIRPILNLKTAQGVHDLRQIALQVVTLGISLGGAVTGEHGDGLARSEWISQAYGPKILQAFCELKQAVDPHNVMNPGKIIDSPPMDTQLRYSDYVQPTAWNPVLRNSSENDARQELIDAIEHCNGAGVCRKEDGVMCPSFQASQDEMHSTRGRANLLRAMISGRFPSSTEAETAVKAALDLCLACKGCQAECPSGVDVARLKYEFTQYYYSQASHRHPWRDYIFGYIDLVARLGQPLVFFSNALMKSRLGKFLFDFLLDISPQRNLPIFAARTFHQQLRHLPEVECPEEEVLLLVDAFNEYFQPEAAVAAVKALRAAGCKVHVLPVLGAGRTLISKGFLSAARKHARKVIEAIQQADPTNQLPIVGIEPSEIFTLRDEYLHFFPGDATAASIASHAWMVDEFLLRPSVTGELRANRILPEVSGKRPPVFLHGHCYQKAQPPAADGLPVGAAASEALLRLAGYEIHFIDSSCCGMAGSFGYEKEHYDFSKKVGEMKLLPAVRAAPADALVAAAGVSCQSQIQDGTGRRVYHPVELIL